MKKMTAIVCIILLTEAACVRQNGFPGLEGDYLGQQAPGDVPELFAPGLVSTGMDDRDITVSPDGNEIFFGVLERPYNTIIQMKRVNGVWQKQEIAPFSGEYNDFEPQFSPDGRRLYFCSERPASAKDTTDDVDIWYVEKIDGYWSDPHNLGSPVNTDQNEFYPSVTGDGTLYYTSHTMKIMRAVFRNGSYEEPEALPGTVNTGAEYNAVIAPDESYLLFTSHSWGSRAGRGDLFVSFRRGDGSWKRPMHLGYIINSYSADMCPSLSPDGKYLFFSSNRPIPSDDPEPVTEYDDLQDTSRQPGNKKFDIYWVRMPEMAADDG